MGSGGPKKNCVNLCCLKMICTPYPACQVSSRAHSQVGGKMCITVCRLRRHVRVRMLSRCYRILTLAFPDPMLPPFFAAWKIIVQRGRGRGCGCGRPSCSAAAAAAAAAAAFVRDVVVVSSCSSDFVCSII